MIDKIHCQFKIGNDIHKPLIAMFQAIQNGWDFPMHISEEEYIHVRDNKTKYSDAYVGLVGFNATFGSKYFGGYARGFKADKVTPRDIPNEALRNLKRQVPDIMDVKFVCGDYKNNEYCNLKEAVIYCDPPYQDTTRYKTDSFDYDYFWNWCRNMSRDNYVYVSEYHAPDDFNCIWTKEVTTSLKVHKHEERIEKLFCYKYGRC